MVKYFSSVLTSLLYFGLHYIEFPGLLSGLCQQVSADLQHSGRLVMHRIRLDMHHASLLNVVFQLLIKGI